MKPLRRIFAIATITLFAYTASVAHAAPLSLDNVTATDAAAQLEARYGVDIEYQGHISRYATFSLDPDTVGNGPLEAVNALSNAVGADFNKTFVLVRTPGPDGDAPQIDTTAAMPTTQTTLPAADAIAMVAGLDDATVPDMTALTGTVTLSSPSLTVAQAAQEIAAQTHTHWRTVYVLTSRTHGRVLGGTVIGRTDGGSPIIELAAVYYHDAKWQARQQRLAADAQRQAQADQQAAAQQQAQQQQQALAYAQAAGQAAQQAALSNLYGTNTSQNGYNPYANNFQNPYNSGAGNGSGLVISGGTTNFGDYGSGSGYAPTYFGNGNY